MPRLPDPLPTTPAPAPTPTPAPDRGRAPRESIETPGEFDPVFFQETLWVYGTESGGWRTGNEDVVLRRTTHENALMQGYRKSGAALQIARSERAELEAAIKGAMVGKTFLTEPSGGVQYEQLCVDQPFKFTKLDINTTSRDVFVNGDATVFLHSQWIGAESWKSPVDLGNGLRLGRMGEEVRDPVRHLRFKRIAQGISVEADEGASGTRVFRLWGKDVTINVREAVPQMNPPRDVQVDERKEMLVVPMRAPLYADFNGTRRPIADGERVTDPATGAAITVTRGYGNAPMMTGVRAGNVRIYLGPQDGTGTVIDVREPANYVSRIDPIELRGTALFLIQPRSRPLSIRGPDGQEHVLPPVADGQPYSILNLNGIRIYRHRCAPPIDPRNDSISFSDYRDERVRTPGEWQFSMSGTLMGTLRVGMPGAARPAPTSQPQEVRIPEWPAPSASAINPANYEVVRANFICFTLNAGNIEIWQKKGMGMGVFGWRNMATGAEMQEHEFARRTSVAYFEDTVASTFLNAPREGTRVTAIGGGGTWEYRRFSVRLANGNREEQLRWGRA